MIFRHHIIMHASREKANTHSQVGVFEERDEVSLGGLLESHDGG